MRFFQPNVLGSSLAVFFTLTLTLNPIKNRDRPTIGGPRMSRRSQGVEHVLGSRAGVRLDRGCAAACAHIYTWREPTKEKYPGVSCLGLGIPCCVVFPLMFYTFFQFLPRTGIEERRAPDRLVLILLFYCILSLC